MHAIIALYSDFYIPKWLGTRFGEFHPYAYSHVKANGGLLGNLAIFAREIARQNCARIT